MKALNKVLSVALITGGLCGQAAAYDYEDSARFNYVGIDYISSVGSDELIGDPGFGMTTGFLHSASVFSKFNIHFKSDSYFGVTNFPEYKQGYNAHIGYKINDRDLTPYIMGGFGFNHLAGDLQHNWFEFDIEAGILGNINYDNNNFDPYINVSTLMSLINYESQFRTLYGTKIEFGAAKGNLNVYTKGKAMASFDSTSFDEQIRTVDFSAGVKYSY